MGELKVTPEGMPKIVLGGSSYPVFFSVYSIQCWAEYKGVDYQQALEDGWEAAKLSLADLSKLLEIALGGGEARRVAFSGGDPRVIGQETLDAIMSIYSPIELAMSLATAWAGLPGGDEKDPKPEAPRD